MMPRWDQLWIVLKWCSNIWWEEKLCCKDAVQKLPASGFPPWLLQNSLRILDQCCWDTRKGGQIHWYGSPDWIVWFSIAQIRNRQPTLDITWNGQSSVHEKFPWKFININNFINGLQGKKKGMMNYKHSHIILSQLYLRLYIKKDISFLEKSRGWVVCLEKK